MTNKVADWYLSRPSRELKCFVLMNSQLRLSNIVSLLSMNQYLSSRRSMSLSQIVPAVIGSPD